MRSRATAVVAVAARGAALFLAIFTVIGLVGELRGRATDLSLWWVDIRDLTGIVRLPLLALFAATLFLWAVRANPGTRLRRAMAGTCVLFALLALRDAARYVSVLGGGLVHPSAPIPLSLVIALGLATLAIAALRCRPMEPVGRRRTAIWLVTAAAAWAFVFPLAQMLFFGTTDYRRPADAAVVFGARVYATGRPSPLLADRIATGVELYRAGLVATLVMSGGDGADGFNEALVMRDEAVAAGVEPAAILVDEAGNTTEATVDNTLGLLAARGWGSIPPRLIAVSQAYHLPRIQLAYANGGIDVLTVPAGDPEPIREMPLLALREVPAFWAYFIRVCLG
jgi:vancomycin permeability regulator SanA